MGDEARTTTSNAGEQVGNTEDFGARTDQLAVLTRGIARLNDNLESTAPTKPSAFTVGNIAAIVSVGIALLIAVFGAINLSGRIDRLDDHITKTEDRLTGRIEKLDDRFLKLDEAVSRSMGAKERR